MRRARTSTTVEGLPTTARCTRCRTRSPILGGAQCGYCTPGILVTAKALLDREPDPTREEIREALSGNLCRCTGYLQIFEAVEQAAAMMRSARDGAITGPQARWRRAGARSACAVIGKPRRRVDGRAKVTGQTRFADDIMLPRMLHCKLLRSPSRTRASSASTRRARGASRRAPRPHRRGISRSPTASCP